MPSLPFLLVNPSYGGGGAPVDGCPQWLGALDPTLGHVEWNVEAAAQGSCSQTQANLPTELQSGVGGTRKPASHSVVESKVNHVEKSVPSHRGSDSLTEQTISSQAVLFYNFSRHRPVISVEFELLTSNCCLTRWRAPQTGGFGLTAFWLWRPRRDWRWRPLLLRSRGQPENRSRGDRVVTKRTKYYLHSPRPPACRHRTGKLFEIVRTWRTSRLSSGSLQGLVGEFLSRMRGVPPAGTSSWRSPSPRSSSGPALRRSCCSGAETSSLSSLEDAWSSLLYNLQDQVRQLF